MAITDDQVYDLIADKESDNLFQTVDLESMIGESSGRYGSSGEEISNLMNRIAHHESAGTNNPELQQYGGGPGRGLFQFEQTYKDPKTGEYGQAGGMTARNRLAEYYKMQGEESPGWLMQEGMDNPEIGFDASRLSPEQQKMMFIANTRMGAGGNFNPENIKDTDEWWAKHHWAGSESDKDARLEEFKTSMGSYK